jgi:transposase
VQRLTAASSLAIGGWRFEPVVRALQALRGIDEVAAIGLVAEIGDIARFAHPRQLMGYLGLVPTEASSGERVRRGAISKTGNAHARRLLTEAAWNYRFRPRVGYRAHQRQEGLSEVIRAHAWKAQLRLTARYARLRAQRTDQQDLRGRRARAGRLYLGHCTHRNATKPPIACNARSIR